MDDAFLVALEGVCVKVEHALTLGVEQGADARPHRAIAPEALT